jgi:hypothetical protein
LIARDGAQNDSAKSRDEAKERIQAGNEEESIPLAHRGARGA